ncbi:MAG: hypothetical protein WCV84_01485 [Patescibacteria group bacterium]
MINNEQNVGTGLSAMEKLMDRVLGHPFPGQGLQLHAREHDCIASVFEALMRSNGADVLYVHAADYEHVGVRVQDPRIKPRETRVLRLLAVITNREEGNVTGRFEEDILVSPNTPTPTKPWKAVQITNLVLFRAGGLHVRKFSAALSEQTFDVLRHTGVIDGAQSIKPYDASTLYQLAFPGDSFMPMFSDRWANPLVMDLVGLLKAEKDLMALVRGLEERVESFNERDRIIPAPLDQSMPREPSALVYARSRPSKENKGPVETYEVACQMIRLKGYKPTLVSPEEITAATPTFPDVYALLRRAKKALEIVRCKVVLVSRPVLERNKAALNLGESKVRQNKGWTAPRTFSKGVLDGHKIEVIAWNKTCTRSVTG